MTRIAATNERPHTTTRRVCLLIALTLSLAAGVQAGEDEPELLVELGRERIYEGESVQYEVTLNRVQDPQPPKLEGFDEFQIEFLGERSLDSQQITIINGRMTKDVRYGRAYRYALTPKRSGTLQIPAPVAEVAGRKLTGRELTLEVIPPSDQDLAVLEIAVDRDRVYPMQPFTVRLTVAVKALPEPVADRNPVTVLRRLPALSIPWANDDSLPAGMHPESSWQKWLGAWQNDRGGFSVNNVGAQSAFSFFDDAPLGFSPEPRRTTRKDRSGKDAAYWEFEFARKFTPHELGEFSFGPVTLKGEFITHVDADSRAETESVFAVAKARTVTVRDAPAEGRPDSFIQAIGKFSLDTTLVPTEAKVGDPLTLTLTLRGEGTLESARAPDLSGRSEVTERFRVYEATEETRAGARLFTYSLRPLQSGQIVFPAIPVSYFDVDKEQYVTLQTQPISLTVKQAERIGEGEIAVAPAARSGGKSVEARRDGILANIDDLAALHNQSVRPARWLAYVGLLGVAYAGIVLVSRQLGRYLGDTMLQRRRAAPGRARQRLQAARAEIQAGHGREGAEHLGSAVVGLVADMAGQSEAGMTSREVEGQLRAWGVQDELRQRIAALLETCDGARYGASAEAVRGLSDTAPAVLEDLIRALKSDRRWQT
jgi:hypothetical protein